MHFARRHGAVARHACSTAATLPVHERRCGEGHGGASPARGWRRGRARGIDGGAWTARRCGEGDGTMPYRAESAMAASRRGIRQCWWRRRRGIDGGAGTHG
jgi:hypothetical protein